MKEKNNGHFWVLYAILMVLTIASYVFGPHLFGVVESNVGGVITWKVEPIFAKADITNQFLSYVWSSAIPNLIKTIQILGIALTAALVLKLLTNVSFKSKKEVTIAKLIFNFLKWVIAIATIFLVMGAWGADTTMMLASAGVFTLVVGLGSQTLVADILAGVFIVFEGDFQVGDIVIIDSWRGEVVSIGIRTTKLMDAGGNIKIINNSEIKSIINQTKELSIAKCVAAISYNVRIEKVEAVIADNIDKIKEKIPAIVEGPFYKGVTELGESSVNLLFVAKCNENDIYQVQRDMNREIKILFDDNNIEIPFNQLVVHMEEDEQIEKATKKDVKKAKEFAEEQKELSKDIELEK